MPRSGRNGARGPAAARPAARSSRAARARAPRRSSASRRPSMNRRSRASVMPASGSSRVPAVAMSVPSGERISRSTTIAGSNRRERRSRAGAIPATASGASSRARARARASASSRASSPERCMSESRASISSQQIGLGDRPGLAAHAEVGRRHGPRSGHDRQDRGREDGGAARHRPSSGPTSGPSRPSQGMSGSATARAVTRSRGTSPISA